MISLSYYIGMDVEQDYTGAYIWASLAKVGLAKIEADVARQGLGKLKLTQLANELIDELYLEMTPAQLLKAQGPALERFNKIEARKAQNR